MRHKFSLDCLLRGLWPDEVFSQAYSLMACQSDKVIGDSDDGAFVESL